jgi:hypothetical protein
MASSNGTPPPSVFAGMPTVSLLEAVVTKDPRWHWLEATWDESDDDSRVNWRVLYGSTVRHWQKSSLVTCAVSLPAPRARRMTLCSLTQKAATCLSLRVEVARGYGASHEALGCQ